MKLSHNQIEETMEETALDQYFHHKQERMEAEKQQQLRDLKNSFRHTD